MNRFVCIMLFSLLQLCADAQGWREHDRHKAEYYKTSFEVFYGGKPLKDANASTFKVLENGYAKDAFRVYYRGRLLKDANASAFKAIKQGYAKDAFRFITMANISKTPMLRRSSC